MEYTNSIAARSACPIIVPGRKGTRVFLVVWSLACLAGYWTDARFPFVLGVLLVALGIAGFEIYWLLGRQLYSLLLLNWLFVLTYPLYLAHLATDQTWASPITSFDGPTYAAVIRLSMAGYAGIVTAELALGIRRTWPRGEGEAPATIAPKKLRSVMRLSVLLYLVALIVIYQSGIGVIGYNARPSIPYVFGFAGRLGQIVVPLMNLFVIGQLLTARRLRELRLFFVFICLEAVGIVFVSLSRYSLLMYVGLPIVLIAMNLSKVGLRKLGFGRIAIVGAVVMLAGVVIAESARNAVFDSLRRGAGYERTQALDTEALNLTALLGSLSFFERLSGARELMWVERGVPWPRFSDVWYTLVTGPPDNDLYYISRQAGLVSENVNEDTGFGSGLTLFANLRFGGRELVLWGGMALITASLMLFEIGARWLRWHDSLTLFVMAILVINLWQGLALLTIVQRPVQMCAVGVALLWWFGGKEAVVRRRVAAAGNALA